MGRELMGLDYLSGKAAALGLDSASARLPVAQAAHRQALPRRGSGTRDSACALMLALAHQQSTAKLPSAATAHRLAAPHRGQV